MACDWKCIGPMDVGGKRDFRTLHSNSDMKANLPTIFLKTPAKINCIAYMHVQHCIHACAAMQSVLSVIYIK